MQRVTVVAKLVAKPGLESRVKKELLKMVEETHKEPGCINYDLHVRADDPKTFLFYENWVSQEALDEHMATPHFKHLKAVAADIFAADPEILLFELISEPKPARR